MPASYADPIPRSPFYRDLRPPQSFSPAGAGGLLLPHDRDGIAILLGMAAEIPEITDSNQEHIYSDLHECLRILTRLESLLVEFQPLLAQFRSPAAAYMTRRASRRTSG